MKTNSFSLDVTLHALCHLRVMMACGCLLVLNAALHAQPVIEAPFTQITDDPVTAQPSQWTTPAWGDYDNDGWLDLFVAAFSSGSRNALFHNNQDGSFSKVTSGPIVTEAAPGTYGAAWADYDNDGWLDLLVSSADRNFQPSRLYRNTGSGSFVRMGAADVGSLATDAAHAFGVAWADYDRDGFLDLFVANGPVDIPQADFLFHNEHNGRFARVTNAITTPELATAHGGWADFDGDGHMDLLVAQLASGNELHRTDDRGQFIDITGTMPPSDTIAASVGVARGDCDNDGDLDVVIINMGWQGPIVRNWFYRNRGDGSLEQVTSGPIAEDEDHFASGSWVDYDNDGWLDLFVTVLGPGTSSSDPRVFSRLYHSQGDRTFAQVTTGSLVTKTGNAGGAAWGDYDNDGFLDVCVAYGTVFSSQRNALFRNNGNANNWIKIRCVGTDSNRSAVGAKVRVQARIGGEDRWQMRQIGCDQDWVAFNSLDAIFGLGDATIVDTLRVEWPSGRVQELRNVSVKQTLTIVERTELAVTTGGAGEVELTLTGPRQQRYRVETSQDLVTWSTAASLTITNANGTASYTHFPASGDVGWFFRATPE
jgi:hypothetical protein